MKNGRITPLLGGVGSGCPNEKGSAVSGGLTRKKGPAVVGGPVPSAQVPVQRNSASTCCGSWLACATIALPACCRMLARDRFAVSEA